MGISLARPRQRFFFILFDSNDVRIVFWLLTILLYVSEGFLRVLSHEGVNHVVSHWVDLTIFKEMHLRLPSVWFVERVRVFPLLKID